MEEAPKIDEKLKLLDAGWTYREDPEHIGSEFWSHPSDLDHTYTRGAALKKQEFIEEELKRQEQ